MPLLKNELHLVAANAFPDLPKRMQPKHLADYTLIFREPGSATLDAMVNYLNKHQINVKRQMFLVSNEAVKQAVRAGLGLSIMPIIGIRSELALQKMKILPIKDLPLTSQWNLAYGNGKNLSPASLALLEYIQEHKPRIIEEHFTS